MKDPKSNNGRLAASRPLDGTVGATRREFLAAGAAVAFGTLRVYGTHQVESSELDPRVREILAKTITVDMHSHRGLSADSPDAANLSGFMRDGGPAAICLNIVADGPALRDATALKPGDLYAFHLQQRARIEELLTKQDIRRVPDMAGLRGAHEQGQPAIIQDSEGADFLEGRLERVEEAHRQGTRKLQLVHYTTAGGIGDFQSGEAEYDGLSPFGVDVVKECSRLGIVIDVAHATFDMVKGVAKATTLPLILSHTALRDSKAQGTYWADNFRGGLPMMRARQVTPDHARIVAETDGVVGVWSLFDSTPKYVEGVKEIVDVVGVDHTGIGTDRPLVGWSALIDEMLRQGFTAEEAGKILGGNFCRVFAKYTQSAA